MGNGGEEFLKEYTLKRTVPKFTIKFIMMFSSALTFFLTLLWLQLFRGIYIMHPFLVILFIVGTTGLLLTVLISIKDWQKHIRKLTEEKTQCGSEEDTYTKEQLLQFKKYFDELYGQGLEVTNWHKNDDLESFDSFYDSAVEAMNEGENGSTK